MKVRIPSSSKEITLREIQLIGTGETPIEQSNLFFKEILKIDPTLFDSDNKIAALATFQTIINIEELSSQKTIEKYKLPERLLNVRVGHLKEMVNIDTDIDFFSNTEIIAGCMYRKDWAKDYSEDEIIETAAFFKSQPLTYTLFAIQEFGNLIKLLKETFPILYDDEIIKQPEYENEGRRMYDMVIGLAKDNPTLIEAVENMKLGTAFPYLEQKKIEFIKKSLNSH